VQRDQRRSRSECKDRLCQGKKRDLPSSGRTKAIETLKERKTALETNCKEHTHLLAFKKGTLGERSTAEGVIYNPEATRTVRLAW